MRGRLTADRVNAALDEMAALAEANAALVAAARRNRACGADKKHAMWIAFHVAVSRAPLRSAGRARCVGGLAWRRDSGGLPAAGSTCPPPGPSPLHPTDRLLAPLTAYPPACLPAAARAAAWPQLGARGGPAQRRRGATRQLGAQPAHAAAAPGAPAGGACVVWCAEWCALAGERAGEAVRLAAGETEHPEGRRLALTYPCGPPLLPPRTPPLQVRLPAEGVTHLAYVLLPAPEQPQPLCVL